MSDQSIPPKPPAPLSVITPPAKGNTPPSSPLRMLAQDAPVRAAPATIHKNKERSTRIEGRVVSYDKARHEARIATKQGDIVIKTDTPLPPDAEVVIELYVKNGAELARIMLLKQQAETAEQTAQLAQSTKAPPLKAGDSVTALLMPGEGEAATSPPAQAAVTLQRVALVLEQLGAADIQKLPQPLPVPPEVAMKLALSGDLFAALQKLPPEQQQAVIDYVTRPDVVKQLATMLPPQALADLTTAPAPAPVEEQPVEIITPRPQQPQAKTVSTTPSQPPQPAAGAMKNLLPLLESLQGMKTAPGELMPRMGTQASSTMLQELLPQNMYRINIVSVTPPGARPPPPAPNVQQGEVDFVTSSGFPVIKSGERHFILREASAVEVGSTVQFEAVPMTPQQIMQSASPVAAPVSSFHPLLSGAWPALQEALQTVAAAAPDVAAQMQNTIPGASPKLAPTALFFLAALKMGVAESWLGGQVMQSLRDAGKQNLADRLNGDFSKISAQSKEPVSGEWRAISMPLLHEGEISQMQFYLRRQQENDDGRKDENGPRENPTRFVLNLHLSRMGDMQLDGLLRKKTFDLILRSREALPATMRQELMQEFAKGLAQAEMQGGISFQTRAQNWVTIDLPQQGRLA